MRAPTGAEFVVAPVGALNYDMRLIYAPNIGTV